MASRLGLKPWEREEMEPAEIREMYDGMIWRLSRTSEIVAIQTWAIRGMLTSEERLDSILDLFPYYVKDSDGKS